MKKKYLKHQAGRYRQTIKLQQYVITRDQFGQGIMTWKTYATERAFVDIITGGEWFAAYIVLGKTNYYVELRWNDAYEISILDRVQFIDGHGNVHYLDITDVYNDDEGNRWIRLLAYELESNQYNMSPQQTALAANVVSSQAAINPPTHTQHTHVTPTLGKEPHPMTAVGEMVKAGTDNQYLITVVFDKDIDTTDSMPLLHNAIQVVVGTKAYTVKSAAVYGTRTLKIWLDNGLNVYAGETVSWAYTDGVTGAIIKGINGKELINQTYPVTNNSSLHKTAVPKEWVVKNGEITDTLKKTVMVMLEGEVDPATIDATTKLNFQYTLDSTANPIVWKDISSFYINKTAMTFTIPDLNLLGKDHLAWKYVKAPTAKALKSLAGTEITTLPFVHSINNNLVKGWVNVVVPPSDTFAIVPSLSNWSDLTQPRIYFETSAIVGDAAVVTSANVQNLANPATLYDAQGKEVTYGYSLSFSSNTSGHSRWYIEVPDRAKMTALLSGGCTLGWKAATGKPVLDTTGKKHLLDFVIDLDTIPQHH